MRNLARPLLVLILLGAALVVPVGPAQAAAHSPEVCKNFTADIYLLGNCVSVHHSAGTATVHLRQHAYKLVNGQWHDMVADSITVNDWTITTNTGFRINLYPDSSGGVSVVTRHGLASVSLRCPGNEPRSANAAVNDISMRSDDGRPWFWNLINLQSGYSARPC
jgi:hypothetical protein